jgi:hypothetical protein
MKSPEVSERMLLFLLFGLDEIDAIDFYKLVR